MSKMTWFKFHSEFRNDPKIKRLPVAERYAFIVLLCLASEAETRGAITGLDDDDIAFELEMQVEDWKTLKAKFKVKGFIDFSQDEILIRNWDKRQYDKPSDHPEATRQRKRLQRERDKLTKSQDVTPCHADVTPMSRGREEENRSDQIRSDQDPFFLEAQEKKIEISLPEQKKDLSAFEDPQIQETPPPTPAPFPPENIGYSDPMGDRFRDVGKRIRQVESWLKDDEFLKYLQPIMKRSDYYKDSTSMGDVRDYVRKAKINTPEKLVFYESLSDRYQDFLGSQQRSPQPMAELPELAAIAPPPDYLRNKFKKVS